MPFEVTCGQCHGALLVEHAGVVVACPTCGAHLEIPADADVMNADGGDVEVPSTTSDVTESEVASSPAHDVLEELSAIPQEIGPVISHSSPYLNHLAALPTSLSTVDATLAPTNGPMADAPTADAPMVDAGHAEPDVPVAPQPGETIASADADQTLVVDGNLPLSSTEPATIVLDEPVHLAALEAASVPAPAFVETRSPAPAPASSNQPAAVQNTIQVDIPPPPRREVVSKQLFFYVASYASAVTLVLIYLLYSVLTYRGHVLESLPDIEPPMKDGKIGMKTAKPQDDVPRGHVLRLGESQRFGNVRVTPLKITRSPVTFQHLFGDRNLSREPSAPVYKLWLKFENVSPDQVFTPLSTPIVYKRYAGGLGNYKTNNFIVADAERMKKNGEVFYLFGLPENSEFAIAGQNLDKPLGPGETVETFLPAEDSLNEITGEWTWRVFFRKGYNPSSHRGVLTVIDVRFDGNAIAADEAATRPS